MVMDKPGQENLRSCVSVQTLPAADLASLCATLEESEVRHDGRLFERCADLTSGRLFAAPRPYHVGFPFPAPPCPLTFRSSSPTADRAVPTDRLVLWLRADNPSKRGSKREAGENPARPPPL